MTDKNVDPELVEDELDDGEDIEEFELPEYDHSQFEVEEYEGDDDSDG